MESAFILSLFISLLFSRAAFGTTFTFVNNCNYTVWPGILANAGSPKLDSTGFELLQDSSRSFTAPTGWSGRFWGRTGCAFSGTVPDPCRTGDCGSGQVECNGFAAATPATLAEITLGTGALDFYDVSLVDGFNLPMILGTTGGSGMCATAGCVTDLNLVCPDELLVGFREACKSACDAYGSPEYCCTGAFNSHKTCNATAYSQIFKSSCPGSYSYAFDDANSTYTCSGADYTVTFCPSMTSQTSSKDPPPTMTIPGIINGDGSQSGSKSSMGETNPDSAMEADGSWLAGLAMGNSNRVYCSSSLHYAVSIAFAIFILSIVS